MVLGCLSSLVSVFVAQVPPWEAALVVLALEELQRAHEVGEGV